MMDILKSSYIYPLTKKQLLRLFVINNFYLMIKKYFLNSNNNNSKCTGAFYFNLTFNFYKISQPGKKSEGRKKGPVRQPQDTRARQRENAIARGEIIENQASYHPDANVVIISFHVPFK